MNKTIFHLYFFPPKPEPKLNNAQSWNSLAANWQKSSQNTFQQFKKMNEMKNQKVSFIFYLTILGFNI